MGATGTFAAALVGALLKKLWSRRKKLKELVAGDSEDIPNPHWPMLVRQISLALEDEQRENEERGRRIQELERALGELNRIHEAAEKSRESARRKLVVARQEIKDLRQQLIDVRARNLLLEERLTAQVDTEDVVEGDSTDRMAAVKVKR